MTENNQTYTLLHERIDAENHEKSPEIINSAPEKACAEKYRLLIVDDEPSMLEGLSQNIDWEAIGYTPVALLDDGRAAIRYLSENPVDVVLTDIRMPGASGVDIAEYIHANSLSARVVLLSGYREFEDAQRAMRYGVQHYLTKPFLLKDVRKTMQEIAEDLGKAREAESVRRRQEEETRRFMRESFFVEAALGALRWKYAFGRWVDILGIDTACLSVRCALVDIQCMLTVAELRGILSKRFGDAFACILRLPGGCARIVLLEGDAIPFQGDGAGDAVTAAVSEAVADAELKSVMVYSDVRALSLAQHTAAQTEDILPPALPAAPEDGAAAMACRYIREHFAQKLTLTEVAKYVYLNPAYLSRMFSEQTGYTFRDYLTNTRIQAAARLLATTKLPVYTICDQVGYNDVKHFYRQFKQIMRVTPSEYRDLSGKDNAV